MAGRTPFLLRLPKDAIWAELEEGKSPVSGFFTSDPLETISEAMTIQMQREFYSAPGETWVYHPKYYETNGAFCVSAELFPSVGISFLDGLWCPTEDISIQEVFDYKLKRAAERDAFMAALFEASEAVEISNHSLILGVPMEKVERALADLNRTAVEQWASGVKRSFRWGIRPNQTTLAKLAAAVAAYDYVGNIWPSVLLGLWGAVECSIDLTPRLEPVSDETKAFSYMWDVKRTFENPEAYTRYRLKSPGVII